MSPLTYLKIAALVGAFLAGVWCTHRYYKGEEAGRMTEALNATHEGWVKATQRWKAKDAERQTVDLKNEKAILALKQTVQILRRSIDNANLIPDDAPVGTCPDPRGPEWLRLYNRAARPAEGSIPQPADGVSEGSPRVHQRRGG